VRMADVSDGAAASGTATSAGDGAAASGAATGARDGEIATTDAGDDAGAVACAERTAAAGVFAVGPAACAASSGEPPEAVLAASTCAAADTRGRTAGASSASGPPDTVAPNTGAFPDSRILGFAAVYVQRDDGTTYVATLPGPIPDWLCAWGHVRPYAMEHAAKRVRGASMPPWRPSGVHVEEPPSPMDEMVGHQSVIATATPGASPADEAVAATGARSNTTPKRARSAPPRDRPCEDAMEVDDGRLQDEAAHDAVLAPTNASAATAAVSGAPDDDAVAGAATGATVASPAHVDTADPTTLAIAAAAGASQAQPPPSGATEDEATRPTALAATTARDATPADSGAPADDAVAGAATGATDAAPSPRGHRRRRGARHARRAAPTARDRT
jgi:S-DNA-T family DNA segregation ATPase FtsK/SpoIIIE